MGTKYIYSGLDDIINGLQQIKLPFYLARSDIRRRYRRSTLGPFWITLSTGIMIATIGLIFGRLFKSNISDFLPFIAVGLILWGYINSVINEACSVFPSSEAVIRQLPLPLFIHVERMIFKNILIFFHNIVIFPLVCLIVQKPISWVFLLSFLGFFIVTVNLAWLSLLLGIVCTRFRDLTQIVGSLLQIAFYVTPIIWMPKLLETTGRAVFLETNPLYHLMEIVRAPLLGQVPTLLNWFVSIGLLVVGWWMTIVVYNKYKKRIAYWL